MTATVQSLATALDRWEMVVGLEVHVQLKTRTKIFCSCSADFGAAPNANTCPVCLALPGALPVLNERAVGLATRAALALNCVVQPVSIFARKNYFYPDLPKGYQISQFDKPLALDGWLEIGKRSVGTPIRIGITRVHMEEDAGKSIHDRFAGATAIDLNRSGVPLIEIVSEPDIRTAEQAGAYLRVLKQVLEYVDVSDVNMEEGSLRVDANVSARRRGETKLGTKTEVKNMNSFSGVERALDVEFARHVAVLEAGGMIEQQTMLWDGSTVRPARSKEGSHDYRYFPEPDLPPLILAPEWIDQVRKDLPELPDARRARFAEDYKLGDYDVEVLTANPRLADYYESVARAHGEPKAAANWVMGEVMTSFNESGGFPVEANRLARLITLVRDGVVSHQAAKRLYAELPERPQEDPRAAAERLGLVQVSDHAALAGWVDEVLAAHPAEVARFKGGETRLMGFFVGQVMKRSQGKADPKGLQPVLQEKLREP